MTEPIAFCDLNRAHVPIRREIDEAIRRTLDRGWFLRGPEVNAFEEEWADYCGQQYAVVCNSGTDALTIAAIALELKSAVIQANTLPLTAIGLRRGGSAVRLADVDSDGRLARNEQDAVPVLLYGRPPTQQEEQAALFDAAHAHGWKPPKNAVAAWSFYPTKSLGALGDGGAITTADKHLAADMRKLSGRDDLLHDRRQITSRMDEVQAAVLRVKLKYLDEYLAERRDIGALYERRLAPIGLPINGPSFYHLFVIRVGYRDGLARFLAERDIATKVHWATPLHLLHGDWSHPESCPMAEDWCNTVLTLPCYPGLKASEVEFICDSILEWTNSQDAQKTRMLRDR